MDVKHLITSSKYILASVGHRQAQLGYAERTPPLGDVAAVMYLGSHYRYLSYPELVLLQILCI